jgi:hypothetical protein
MLLVPLLRVLGIIEVVDEKMHDLTSQHARH